MRFPYVTWALFLAIRFSKRLVAPWVLVTGWDNPRDNNGSPSGLFGVNFTPTDTFALASNIVVGPEQTHNTRQPTFYLEQRRHDQANGSSHASRGIHVWYGAKRIDADGR